MIESIIKDNCGKTRKSERNFRAPWRDGATKMHTWRINIHDDPALHSATTQERRKQTGYINHRRRTDVKMRTWYSRLYKLDLNFPPPRQSYITTRNPFPGVTLCMKNIRFKLF